jgi:hypothetical protein
VAGVVSSFYMVLYTGISLPVIGEGIGAGRLGLQYAGIAFSIPLPRWPRSRAPCSFAVNRPSAS